MRVAGAALGIATGVRSLDSMRSSFAGRWYLGAGSVKAAARPPHSTLAGGGYWDYGGAFFLREGDAVAEGD